MQKSMERRNLDTELLKRAAKSFANTDTSAHFLDNLDSEFPKLFSDSGTTRSKRLAPDKPTMVDGSTWSGGRKASMTLNETDAGGKSR
jgi:hypothetical protein